MQCVKYFPVYLNLSKCALSQSVVYIIRYVVMCGCVHTSTCICIQLETRLLHWSGLPEPFVIIRHFQLGIANDLL